jgi:DNA primase
VQEALHKGGAARVGHQIAVLGGLGEGALRYRFVSRLRCCMYARSAADINITFSFRRLARFPEAEIERLKSEVSVERLVESAGIVLKKSGEDRIGTCPFHEDGEPSLVVTPSKNLWLCFGCQIGGGPIDWVMKLRGDSFRHAVELLKADPASAAQGAPDGPIKHARVRSLPPPVAFDADDQALLAQTIGYYHETLKQSPEALAYLQARGLDHPELVAHFKLGYANRTPGLRLPE